MSIHSSCHIPATIFYSFAISIAFLSPLTYPFPFPLSPGFRPPFAIPCPDPSLPTSCLSIYPSIRFSTPSPPFSTRVPTYLSHPILSYPTLYPTDQHTQHPSRPVSQYVLPLPSPPFSASPFLSFSFRFLSSLLTAKYIHPTSIHPFTISLTHTKYYQPAQARQGGGFYEYRTDPIYMFLRE